MRVALMAVLCVFLSMGCEQSQSPESQTQKSETTSKSPAEKPGTSESAQVIIPGQGVGELRFGMSQSELEKILGKPDRSMGRANEYLSKGMAVLGSKDSAVGGIMFGDINNPNSPLVKACKFKTAKGIGMGSTLDELKEAYGEPSSVNPMGKGQLVSYKQLGATFALQNDAVIHMSFRQLQFTQP